jgi:hypothetical protein
MLPLMLVAVPAGVIADEASQIAVNAQ